MLLYNLKKRDEFISINYIDNKIFAAKQTPIKTFVFQEKGVGSLCGYARTYISFTLEVVGSAELDMGIYLSI